MQQRKIRSGNVPLSSSSLGDTSLEVVADTETAKRSSRKKPAAVAYSSSAATVTFGWMLLFAFMAGGCLWGYHQLLQWEAQEEQRILERLRREEMDPMTKEWEEKLLAMQEENANLVSQQHHHSNKDETPPGGISKAAEQKMKNQIQQLRDYKWKMHTAIKDMSRRALLEKYGPGPHRVEIQLAFDPQSNIPGTADRILIEMAPVEEMPHAVYTFLEQVTRGFYNDCSFHRNAGHVVQAGPTANFATPPDSRLAKRFREKGLASVKFQEYSPKFPHVKYTLGYAGRPGGPDFYVSTMDNTENHGPGGQTDYDDPSEADPCFAKVVEGFDAVDRMAKAPVADEDYRHMVHNVAIRKMTLLNNPRKSA